MVSTVQKFGGGKISQQSIKKLVKDGWLEKMVNTAVLNCPYIAHLGGVLSGKTITDESEFWMVPKREDASSSSSSSSKQKKDTSKASRKWEGGATAEGFRLDLQGYTDDCAWANWQLQWGSGGDGKKGGSCAMVLMQVGVPFKVFEFFNAIIASEQYQSGVSLTYSEPE